MDLLTLLAVLTTLGPVDLLPRKWEEVGIASTFRTGKDGRHLGGPPACLKGRGWSEVDPNWSFCAHRTAPCGSVLLVQNVANGKVTRCAVIDAGPWGAMHEGRWVLKRRRSDPGTWRGVVDLSPAAAAAIGSTGWTRVRIRRVPAPEPTRCGDGNDS